MWEMMIREMLQHVDCSGGFLESAVDCSVVGDVLGDIDWYADRDVERHVNQAIDTTVARAEPMLLCALLL
jgi:hypothetical protein